MIPLFFSLSNLLQLMVIPNSDAQLDGRLPFSKTYNIFIDRERSDPMQCEAKATSPFLQRINDPDYFGYLGVKGLAGSFIYVADGKRQLSADEKEQLIEQISEWVKQSN
jgi:hypothetical protein